MSGRARRGAGVDPIAPAEEGADQDGRGQAHQQRAAVVQVQQQVNVGIGVQEDLVLAQRIGIAEMQSLDRLMANPPPRALIVGLGDANVQICFRGWVDQRSHDFASVRSEAIRRVKLALEAADMDMPEPIYRVRLTGKHPAPASALAQA